jgi:peptidylprolyl isomerase
MSDQLQAAERPPADQPTSAEAAANARRRGQALAGALAGVAVIVVLVAVFVGIKVSGDDKPAAAPAPAASAAQPQPADTAPSQPADTAPSQPAAAAPQQPQPADLPPGLSQRPVVKAGGTKRLTKLTVTTLVKGSGAPVKNGQTITANYVLAGYADGKVIEASWDTGQPVQLQIGQLIPGFDQGVIGVPVGSRVQLDIPAKLAYGDKPTSGQPSGDLRFVVDVLAAQ